MNRVVEILGLAGNERIGPTGVAAIARGLRANHDALAPLTRLDLRSTTVSEEGAAALADALLSNASLTDLNLRFSSLTDSGARELASVITFASHLTTLDVSANSLSPEAKAELRRNAKARLKLRF